MKFLLLLFSCLSIISHSFCQIKIKKDQDIFTNYRIFPSTVTQTEVLSANHPYNSGTMFISANTITFQPSFFVSEGVYITTDNGSSWFGSDTCKGAAIAFHGGDPGITIDKDGRFILTRLGRTPFAGLYSHYSTDMGLTWSNQYTLTNADLERAVLASDNNHNSSFFGRSYGIWIRWSPPYPLMFAFTDNGAVNWSNPAQVNNPSQRCSGGDMTMGLNGEILACWAGVAPVSPFTEVHTGFASSINGGTDWDIQETAFSMQGIQGLLPEKQNIRVNGLPKIAVDTTGGPRNGWIYIITTQKNLSPAGTDPDVILNRSTDGGSTWSSGIRVNQDQLNNGKVQYFPALHIDIYGGVNVLYYDDRSTTSDSAGVFLSRSSDGGDTWKDFEISDHNFKPSPIGGLGQGYQGDNITITSENNILFPFWMDNSSGIYQIWSANIDLHLVDVYDASPAPEEYKLHQNFPNPFNPSTKISYTLKDEGNIKLIIYDIKGEVVSTLVNEKQQAGSYEFDFRLPGNISTGVYFYRFTVADNASRPVFADVKKMIFLK